MPMMEGETLADFDVRLQREAAERASTLPDMRYADAEAVADFEAKHGIRQRGYRAPRIDSLSGTPLPPHETSQREAADMRHASPSELAAFERAYGISPWH